MSRAAQLVRDPSHERPQIRVRPTLTFKSPPPSSPTSRSSPFLPPSLPQAAQATPSSLARNFTYSSDAESPPVAKQPRGGTAGGNDGGGNSAYRDRSISVESSDDDALAIIALPPVPMLWAQALTGLDPGQLECLEGNEGA